MNLFLYHADLSRWRKDQLYECNKLGHTKRARSNPGRVVTRWDIQDVIDPNKLLFVVRRGSDTGPAISRAKASIYPDVGAQVMQVSEDTDQHTHSRHPGHNVNNIDNIRI